MAYTTIKDPSAYFQTKLYTGGTAEAKTFDGNSNLKPDLFWSKKRGAVQNNFLADSVRGTTYALVSNTTGASYTNSETAELTSFDTNGFTFSGTGDTYNGTYQSDSYVAWGWKANGTGVSNTSGSITSTVSASATSGFSIVSYTGNGSAGATIGHGLSAPLGMVIVKARDEGGNWRTFHKSLATDQYVTLDETNAVATYSGIFPTSGFTNNVFSVGNHSSVNGSGATFIAYCFAEKQGYSKFGSYTGNGNADGTFVYTGFKPAWLMIKRTDSADAWFMFDNKRAGAYSANTNPSWEFLLANATNTGANTDRIDLYSNGFKMRYAWDSINALGGSYIYMAFASEPLVGDNPATAR